MDHRYGKVEWGPQGERKRTTEDNWKNPMRWNAKAREFKKQHGHRPRVFCASLADVFDNQVPSEWRRDLFALIRDCRRLDWLLLTKRPQNIQKMLPSHWGYGYRNVWLGVTAENQEWFDRRWKHLQNIPAIIKFISYEPAIGPLRLPKHGPLPDWLISGEGRVAAKRVRSSPSGFEISLGIAASRELHRSTSSGDPIKIIPSLWSKV